MLIFLPILIRPEFLYHLVSVCTDTHTHGAVAQSTTSCYLTLSYLIWEEYLCVDNDARCGRNMPSASPLFTSEPGMSTEKWAHLKPGEQIQNTKRHEGLHRLPEILYSLCFLSVSPSLSQLPPPHGSASSIFCFFLVLPSHEKKAKRAFAHLSAIEVAGAWEENYGNRTGSLSLCLSCLLSRSWGVFMVCLYWKLVWLCALDIVFVVRQVLLALSLRLKTTHRFRLTWPFLADRSVR